MLLHLLLSGWVGPNCARFGGEGTGSHCLIDVTIEENVQYSVRLFMSGTNASGVFWTGEFGTPDGQSTVIGTLFHPNFAGNSGYGMLQVSYVLTS